MPLSELEQQHLGISIPDPKKPLTKKQLREMCKKQMIQTKIKLKSKWRAQIKYKVLTVFQLSDKERRNIAKMLVLAITPQKAKDAILGKPDWFYRDIALVHNYGCGVLRYKGIDVCLYYMRQYIEIEPVATDPIPIGALESESDLWARLDLLSKSPRQLVGEVREELLNLSMEVEELKHSLAAREILLEQKEQQIKTLTEKQKRRKEDGKENHKSRSR